MSISQDECNQIIRNSFGRVFTFDEARRMQKLTDSFPTTSHGIRWRNVKTGGQVYFT